jgi:ubiquinone/menaquinone biosynthesis C-methylase UbiE
MLSGDEKISSYWSNTISNNTLIQNMLREHSNIKMLYYDKYAKNSRLLELAGGKANDLRKWMNSNISYVTLVEIDINAIEEAKKRVKEAKWEKVEFINLDLQKNIYLNNKPYDVVSCQLAFHYFLKDETTLNNIFNTIDKNLIKGGRLMISCLDGKKILELFKKEKSNIIFMKENMKNLFILKVDDYQESINKFKNNLLGNTLDVYVQTIGTLNREYIVNFELLNKYLNEKKYKLIEKFDFQPGPKLKPSEKNYSSLHFMAIFQKLK